MQVSSTNSSNTIKEEHSFIEIIVSYLKYWPLFLISLIVCIGSAFAYLRYTTPQYYVSAKVIIKEGEKNQAGVDVSTFNDLGIVTQTQNLDNEIEFLLSKELRKSTVDSLGFGVSYYKEGRIKDNEIYKNSPVFVSVIDFVSAGYFTISKISGNALVIESDKQNFKKIVQFDEQFHSPWGILSIQSNPWGSARYPIIVGINHPQDLPNVNVKPLNRVSCVVNVSLVTPCPEKGKDFVNALIDIYNQKTIEEKNFTATNTNQFIDERLAIISGELGSAEKNVGDYKQSQGVTDINTETQLFLSKTNDYNSQIAEKEIQLNLLKFTKDFLNNPENTNNIVPANVGLTDPTILNLVSKYNQEMAEKNNATAGMKAENPQLKEYNAKVQTLKEDLLKGIRISDASLQLTTQELRKQGNLYASKTRILTTQEIELRDLYRQKEIKESLFIYLLQKREETGLSMALATPNAKILDKASYSMTPISPNSNQIYLMGLLAGLVIPISIVYTKNLLDTKLRSKKQLTNAVKAPFLGEIPKVKGNDPFPVLKLRSGMAEKFRLISSNLNFITGGSQKDKVVIVTSTVSGEGKSFFSRNLALSLATSGKKTLLIDLDMRRSQMHQVVDLNVEKGLAIYLSDSDTQVNEIIDTSGCLHKNLDIIPTKNFPPNPAELLDSPRLEKLFEELKGKYDYIILDTAPLGLVADVFRINQFTSACIYVVRENYTNKYILKDIQELYKNHRLKNLTCVLNATSQSGKYGYGDYKHNYYHNED